MRDQHGLKAKGNTESKESQHQGDTGYDIGIQHRNVGDPHDDGLGNLFHAVDRDGCRGADDGGDQRGQECDQQSILQGSHDVAACKHLGVPLQGEPAPLGPGLGTCGPAYSWNSLPDLAKWILSFLMLVGRLELFSVLLLFYPGFWKNR